MGASSPPYNYIRFALLVCIHGRGLHGHNLMFASLMFLKYSYNKLSSSFLQECENMVGIYFKIDWQLSSTLGTYLLAGPLQVPSHRVRLAVI